MTVADLERICTAMPGALLPATDVLALLRSLGTQESSSVASPAPVEPTWRERIWVCPDATVLNINEVAEAVCRTPDAVRHLIRDRDRNETLRPDPLPFRRIGTGKASRLTFRAVDVRNWLTRQQVAAETVIPIQRRRATR